MTQLMTHTRRNNEIDIMKGIAILLMIYAHVSMYAEQVHNWIFSFHMPLFFFLAGYMHSNKSLNKHLWSYTLKNAKRLLLPYMITMLLICIWIWKFEIIKLRFNLNIHPVINMLWGSGDMCQSPWGDLYIGPLWFLIAIFVTRELFHVLYHIIEKIHSNQFWARNLMLFTCVVLSIIAIILYPKFAPLPWNILPGVAALLFYAIGWYVKDYSIPNWIRIVCVISWILAVFLGGIDMRTCSYECLPLDVIGALGGIVVLKIISKYINQFSQSSILLKNISLFFSWCGISSLCILCIHSLDTMGGVTQYIMSLLDFGIALQPYLRVILNFLVPLSCTFVIFKVPFLRKWFY